MNNEEEQPEANVSNATHNSNADQTQNLAATFKSGECDDVIKEAEKLQKEVQEKFNEMKDKSDEFAPSTQHNKSGTLQGAVEQNSSNALRLGMQLGLQPYKDKLEKRLENLKGQIEKMNEYKKIIDNPSKSQEEKEGARRDFDIANNNYNKIKEAHEYEQKNQNLAYFKRGVKDSANIIDNVFAYPASAIERLFTGQNGNKYSEYLRLSNIAQGSGQLLKKSGQVIYNRITSQRGQDDNEQQRLDNTRPRSNPR